MRLSIVTSAVVAALVGFGSTIAIIIAAAQAVGADPAQTSSWVAALCLATAAISGILSVRYRIPVVAAWSTPGAALIAASSGISIHAAVGSFILAGALIVLTAFIKPFGRLIERIPTPIAAAMLAGILIRFVLAVFESAQAAPGLVLPLVGLFLVVRLYNAAFAVLAVLFVGLGLAFAGGLAQPLVSESEPVLPHLHQTGLGADGPDRARNSALPGHDGLAEPARFRGSAGIRVHASVATHPGRFRPRLHHHGIFRCPYEQSRGDLGSDLHRAGHPSRPGQALDGRAVLYPVLSGDRRIQRDPHRRDRRAASRADQDSGGTCPHGRLRGCLGLRPFRRRPKSFRQS